MEPSDRLHVTALGCSLTVLACSVLALAQNPRDEQRLGPEPFRSRVVATGLENPWEIAWGPDGHLWITERTGFRVTRINPADGSRRVALVVADVYQSVDQDGLLGLALHPDLLQGKGRDYVFTAYTYDRDPGPGVERRIRIRRYTYDGARQSLVAPRDVLAEMPAHDDHGGGRLAVGPDAKLYFTRGDLGGNWLANFCNPIRAQALPSAGDVRARNWSAYQGKVLRLNQDGSIPADNPVLDGVRSHIHSYGYRNPQGLAFGPGGQLYASDHGPGTDDEVNLVTAGRNYGWPFVAGFKDDQAYVYANWSQSAPAPCQSLTFDRVTAPPSVPQLEESAWQHPDFTPPLVTLYTVPADYDLVVHGNATVAPSSVAVYTSPAIPGWAASILVTGLRTGALYRVKLSGDGRAAAGSPLAYFRGGNRYRDVAISPDGRSVYLSTDNWGVTNDDAGRRTETLANPGALLEFTYTGPPTNDGR
jgi:PQQ-dependent dehydrogenase (s-GDH family)